MISPFAYKHQAFDVLSFCRMRQPESQDNQLAIIATLARFSLYYSAVVQASTGCSTG